MKRAPLASIPPTLALQAAEVGEMLARMRHSRHLRQEDAGRLAGVSRNTIYRIENGDTGVAIGMILCYLEAMAPGATLSELFDKRSRIRISLQIHEARGRSRVVLRAGEKKLPEVMPDKDTGTQEAN